MLAGGEFLLAEVSIGLKIQLSSTGPRRTVVSLVAGRIRAV